MRRPLGALRSARYLLALVLLALVAGLAASGPAAAAPHDPPPGDPGGGEDPGPTFFRWDDDKQKAFYEGCVTFVERAADGTLFYKPPTYPAEVKTSQDYKIFDAATDHSWRMLPHPLQTFTFHAKCHTLLPGDWLARVPKSFYSEAFNRCLANVGSHQRTYDRPQAVPVWFWERAMQNDSCDILLPRGAFGLGSATNAWSSWTPSMDFPYPTTHENAALMEAYKVCQEFVGWRMGNGTDWRGGMDKYGRAPRSTVPTRTWHEALNFYVDPTATDLINNKTEPGEWFPKCGLILMHYKCDPKSAGGSLVPEICAGGHGITSYDINYSEFSSPADDESQSGTPSFGRNLWGGSTAFAFFIGKEAVHVALWMVDWGYNFKIGKLNGLAINIGDDYQDQIVNNRIGLRLKDLFWLVLMFWAGFAALRGRLAMAGSELLLTFVMLGLSAFLIGHREMYMDATWRLMTESSNTLLSAGLHQGDTDQVATDAQLVEKVQGQVKGIFVADSYDILNWGKPLGSAADGQNPMRNCARARDYIVEQGPHSSDPFPRMTMRDAGPECADLVKFDFEPNGTRLMGAILMMISAITVAVLLGIMSLTIVVGKFVALLLFAVAPLAALFCIPPGAGRKLAWSWASTLIQVVLGVIGMSFLLSLLLLTLLSVSKAAKDVPLIERFLLMNLVIFVVFAARRSLLHSGQRLAGRLSEYMSAPRTSGMSWAQAASSSSGSGLNLLNIDRTVGAVTRGVAWGTLAPAALLGQTYLMRLQERRVARRSYRNLQKVAHWKRGVNARNEKVASRLVANRRRVPVHRRPLP